MAVHGTVNYFGKVKSIEKIKVAPILLTKGPSKIALYGIGHVKDHRLNFAFESGNIEFVPPPGGHEDWLNLLVLH